MSSVVCKFARVLLSSDPTLAPRVYSMGPYQQAPNTDWVSSRYISYPTLKMQGSRSHSGSNHNKWSKAGFLTISEKFVLGPGLYPYV